MSYAVTARSREIGIRMALGATIPRIVALVATRTLCLTVVGLASGAAVAMWLGPLLEGLLFGVHARHAPVFLAASAIVVTAEVLSCGSPVWRATKVAPVDILNST
jgi:ABC-type antimicrobial peptide transport system permease subunit